MSSPTDQRATVAAPPASDQAHRPNGRYHLEARYTDDAGTVLATGLQTLARIPIDQLRADRAVGLRTAALVTGYPGSPLGGFDAAADAAAAA
ncbi:MAG TPA: hypothetical protein DEP69_01550, partial [Acidimicrobiaceae bacterium]|nr:hypothetical protein [Acidimicrobiaceae bacterium]